MSFNYAMVAKLCYCRFLVISGKYEKAKQVVQKIGKVNKRHVGEFKFKEELKKRKANTNTQTRYGYMDLFRYKSLRFSTIGGSLIFFAIYFVYYGTTFALSTVAGNIYVNVLLASGAELLAYLATVPLATKVKRKVTLILSFLVAGGFAFSFFFLTIPDSCLPADQTCTQKTLQTVFVAVSQLMLRSLTFVLDHKIRHSHSVLPHISLHE